MGRIFCLGEVLADDFCGEIRAGGAPANVAVWASRFGAESYFVGGISDDSLGKFLSEKLTENGVCLKYAAKSDLPTARAEIRLIDGERHFRFFADDTADTDMPVIKGIFRVGDTVHFCSVALRNNKSAQAHREILNSAIGGGAIVSFDVNARSDMWKSAEELKEVCLEFIKYADIVKLSEEEADFFAPDIAGIFEAADRAKVVVVTYGANGSKAFFPDGAEIFCPAEKVNVVDTTGAGDCFCASILYKISENGLKRENFGEYLGFAAKNSAAVVGKKGAF